MDFNYNEYIKILKEELVPAMGCTEPIALAYAAAKAREVLGMIPDRVKLETSGSIIKNVRSVVVPNTDNMKGMQVAVAAGIIAGNSEKKLEVISEVNSEQIKSIKLYLNNKDIEVIHVDNGFIFDIIITVYKNDSYVKVRIVNYHTNIVLIEKDGSILYKLEIKDGDSLNCADRSTLSIEGIWNFINILNIEDIKETLDSQINYNMAISEEGLRGNYGCNIGKLLFNSANDAFDRATARAAAGSDARMNGCNMPVIINSGSGNQGIACSVPIISYARELNLDDDKLYRALALSNLVTIYQKMGIGSLSGFCGVVVAGISSGGGLSYLCGGDYDAMTHTIVNGLAMISGIICDGAKSSCAGKIVSSVGAGVLGYKMYKNGKSFHVGDGIVQQSIEETIKCVGNLAKEGMKYTNDYIINTIV